MSAAEAPRADADFGAVTMHMAFALAGPRPAAALREKALGVGSLPADRRPIVTLRVPLAGPRKDDGVRAAPCHNAGRGPPRTRSLSSRRQS